MKQHTRIIMAIIVIIFLSGIVITVDTMQRRQSLAPEPGSIPVIVQEKVKGYILPSQLLSLDKVNFIDSEEGKQQEGWLLSDVLDLAIDSGELGSKSVINVSSSSRNKSVAISWAEIQDRNNLVMFDMSNKGTLKLVSEKLVYLDTREEWVQDVDIIEVSP
ncbi:MAG: hypothetical protein P1S60_18940 [Anaerolineae bacterium]|nr:hypothetical protein [Anaerolineae bacterium]